MSEIEELDVSAGRNHARGARNGLLVGFAGSVAMIAAGAAADSEFSAVIAVGGSVIFLPLATITGAILGSQEWRRVIPQGLR